ncbi:hypothetical protein M9H77_08821 [Catharanthus roseus]|uniref:Uncharacterized protein n=1 Tax=Catharanthus roseus TaxID=4058 RepID=A0ACC0BZ18_CATRO|nr:hypothetical protein M9H77_08821 [Catharanthus roseus]
MLFPNLISCICFVKLLNFFIFQRKDGSPGKNDRSYRHQGRGGDVFHDIIKIRPHEFSKMTPRYNVSLSLKYFNIIYHVDINGPNSLVTWILEYEKLKEDSPHPGTLLNYLLHIWFRTLKLTTLDPLLKIIIKRSDVQNNSNQHFLLDICEMKILKEGKPCHQATISLTHALLSNMVF